MRLCVVAGSFHPEIGGPSTYLHRLIPALIERGHNVTVVTYTDAGHSGRDGNFSYPVYRVSRRWPLPLRLLMFRWRVLLEARTVDLFFVSDYGLPVALANLILRKPMVLKNVSDFAWEFSTRHGWLPHGETIDEFQLRRHGWRVRGLQWLCSWYLRAADVVIVPSDYIGRLVAGWGVAAERTRVIYNALEADQFASLPERAAARALCGLPEKAPMLLTAARLASWKGISGIIRALPPVQRRFPDVRLLIAGDGPERAELQALAADHGNGVQFLGALSQQRVHELMRAADVFVLFSTYEGLPHTVLEAIACRTPVVASAVGGTVEILSHECNGLLVPAGDEEALAAAICRVLQEPQFGRELADRAYGELERFSWERMLADTEATLLEAAA